MAAEEHGGSPTDSLEAFAADLSTLRMGNAARQAEVFRWHRRDVDEVAKKHDVSRSAIYAAFSGKTLPQVPTLLAVLEVWDQGGAESRLRWLKRRDELQRQLALLRPGRSGRPLPLPSDEHTRALREYLKELRKKYGAPTIKSIAQIGNGSPVTLAAALRGPHLPSWDTVEVFLRGLLGGLEEDLDDLRYKYDAEWNDAAALLRHTDSERLRVRALWLNARIARSTAA